MIKLNEEWLTCHGRPNTKVAEPYEVFDETCDMIFVCYKKKDAEWLASALNKLATIETILNSR